MRTFLLLVAGLAVASCGTAPPEPSPETVRSFTRELERKQAAKDDNVTNAADARADVRADAAAERIATNPVERCAHWLGDGRSGAPFRPRAEHVHSLEAAPSRYAKALRMMARMTKTAAPTAP